MEPFIKCPSQKSVTNCDWLVSWATRVWIRVSLEWWAGTAGILVIVLPWKFSLVDVAHFAGMLRLFGKIRLSVCHCCCHHLLPWVADWTYASCNGSLLKKNNSKQVVAPCWAWHNWMLAMSRMKQYSLLVCFPLNNVEVISLWFWKHKGLDLRVQYKHLINC